jgi:hypothetical protein
MRLLYAFSLLASFVSFHFGALRKEEASLTLGLLQHNSKRGAGEAHTQVLNLIYK